MNYDEFLLKLKEAGIDRDEFAELNKTNKLTMNGWATTRQGRKTPEWVDSWINLYLSNRDKDIIIRELKNKNNYRHAIRQLEKTLENLSDELASYHSVHGRLVWRTKKAPKMNADPILLKLSRSFKKRNGDFKMEGSPFKESSSDFLGCDS